MSSETPYDALMPEALLAAVEAAGWRCSGHLLALNSFENRVYQIGLEAGGFIVGKFYRPKRWSDEQILEEHAFLDELYTHELSVVAPLKGADGATLFHEGGFRFALFPRQGGHPPNIESESSLTVLGRTIGRIHRVGASRVFEHRPRLSATRLGTDSREFLLDHDVIPAELREAYATTTAHLLERINAVTIPADGRIHGDCHPGNVLWRGDLPHFVDFDDSVVGPAVQDLWMLLSGDREACQRQLDCILSGYQEFQDFDTRELALIEPLRTLRLMHYSAWIARRWHDPAFPHAFTWFGTTQYWSEHVLELREQLAALDEAPLAV